MSQLTHHEIIDRVARLLYEQDIPAAEPNDPVPSDYVWDAEIALRAFTDAGFTVVENR